MPKFGLQAAVGLWMGCTLALYGLKEALSWLNPRLSCKGRVVTEAIIAGWRATNRSGGNIACRIKVKKRTLLLRVFSVNPVLDNGV